MSACSVIQVEYLTAVNSYPFDILKLHEYGSRRVHSRAGGRLDGDQETARPARIGVRVAKGRPGRFPNKLRLSRFVAGTGFQTDKRVRVEQRKRPEVPGVVPEYWPHRELRRPLNIKTTSDMMARGKDVDHIDPDQALLLPTMSNSFNTICLQLAPLASTTLPCIHLALDLCHICRSIV